MTDADMKLSRLTPFLQGAAPNEANLNLSLSLSFDIVELASSVSVTSVQSPKICPI